MRYHDGHSEVFVRCVVVLTAFLALAQASLAGVATINSQASFQSAGTIVYNTNWDIFTGGYLSPGDNYTVGGVTYTTGNNLLVGPASGYGNLRTMFFYASYTPLTGTIEPGFEMLGFSGGVLSEDGSNSLVDIFVSTNFGAYQFNGVVWPYATGPLQFIGFVTTSPSEYFTGFAVSTQNGYNWAAGITDVQLGNTIPEPSSTLMAGCALLILGAFLRRRRNI